MPVLVAGPANLETSVPVEGFPLHYAPARHADGIHTTVSGVGWNIARALHTLGSPVRLVTFVGDDQAGAVVTAETEASGIDVFTLPAERTPRSVILHTAAERVIFTDIAGTGECRVPEDVWAEALDGAALAVLGNVNWTRALLAPTAAAGVPIATDLHAVSGPGNPYDADYLDHAGILFLSAEALPVSPEDFVGSIRVRCDPEVIGIGMGAAGALVAPRGEVPTMVPAPDLRPAAATTGGGDALLAGFVHFRALGAVEAMRRAVAFASWKVGEPGGAEGFLTAAEVERLVAGP
jgi:ribokinase